MINTVLLSYKRPIEPTLESIRRQTVPHRLWIVKNDDSPVNAEADVIRCDNSNYGMERFIQARNIVSQNRDVFVFVDDDVILMPNAIDRLLVYIEKNNADVAGWAPFFSYKGKSGGVSSCFMAAKPEVIDKFELPEDKAWFYGIEDSWFSLKAIDQGFKVISSFIALCGLIGNVATPTLFGKLKSGTREEMTARYFEEKIK